MLVIKKILAFIYLLAVIVVLVIMAGITYGSITDRIIQIIETPTAQMVITVCLVILALGALITVLVTLFARREPTCVHPGGNPEIEITRGALESTVRAAAESEDVLVESVDCRIRGRAQDQVRVTVEVIAFTNHGLAQLAERIQDCIERACADMLGTPGVTARVRFLPAQTTVETKEASS